MDLPLHVHVSVRWEPWLSGWKGVQLPRLSRCPCLTSWGLVFGDFFFFFFLNVLELSLYKALRFEIWSEFGLVLMRAPTSTFQHAERWVRIMKGGGSLSTCHVTPELKLLLQKIIATTLWEEKTSPIEHVLIFPILNPAIDNYFSLKIVKQWP